MQHMQQNKLHNITVRVHNDQKLTPQPSLTADLQWLTQKSSANCKCQAILQNGQHAWSPEYSTKAIPRQQDICHGRFNPSCPRKRCLGNNCTVILLLTKPHRVPCNIVPSPKVDSIVSSIAEDGNRYTGFIVGHRQSPARGLTFP